MTPLEIRTRRKSLKMTQSEFANILGTNDRVVRSWELGERKPSRANTLLIDLLLQECRE